MQDGNQGNERGATRSMPSTAGHGTRSVPATLGCYFFGEMRCYGLVGLGEDGARFGRLARHKTGAFGLRFVQWDAADRHFELV
jgi:hypothetical protein